MRSFLVFVFLIGVPLVYLWEHACSFQLCQQVKRLEERKQRQQEVNDSLSARLASLNSRHGVEVLATAVGMERRNGPSLRPPASPGVQSASSEPTAVPPVAQTRVPAKSTPTRGRSAVVARSGTSVRIAEVASRQASQTGRTVRVGPSETKPTTSARESATIPPAGFADSPRRNQSGGI